uniref:R13L1/DRL21-like LRR repeat region domain-containing protein n=2 Tax=Daucus carota subsp. sativus TaxID=79200 RepID=A0A161ZNZ1_DAUCS|nr:PREDICTED: putative disease resistance protein RGA1 [Daucus carota subsp. sativus]
MDRTIKSMQLKGKKFPAWITMMLNLVKITLRDCNRCEVLPPLGHLPKLREIAIDGMRNVRVVGDDFCGGQSVFPQLERLKIENCARLRKILPSCFPSLKQLFFWQLPNLEEWEAAVISTAVSSQSGFPKLESLEIWRCPRLRKILSSCFPSLKQLYFRELPNLEEWEAAVIGTGVSSQSGFPKLESLEILECPRLRKIPNSYFPSLKKLELTDLESDMMLGTMSRVVSSLTSLLLMSIGDGGGDSSSLSLFSNMESLINNSLSLTKLELIDCKGLKCLTLGSSLEHLKIYNCPHLIIINLVEGSAGPKSIEIGELPPSLLDGGFAQIQSSRLEYLGLGPFSDLDYIPWPFSSSSNLILLDLFGWEKVKSLALFEQPLFIAYPALTILNLHDFEGVKALPDSIAKLPSLQDLSIFDCKNLESLPPFEESHTLQTLNIVRCPVLKRRCSKGQGPEWFKIQYVPSIIWDYKRWQ